MILVYYDLLYAPDAAACVWSPPPSPPATHQLPACTASTHQLTFLSTLLQQQPLLSHCVQTVNTLIIPMLVSLILSFSNCLILSISNTLCSIPPLSTVGSIKFFDTTWDGRLTCAVFTCVCVNCVYVCLQSTLAVLVQLTNLCYMLIHLCLDVCCACIQAMGRAGAVCGPRVITDTRHGREEADPLLLSADAPAFSTLVRLTYL